MIIVMLPLCFISIAVLAIISYMTSAKLLEGETEETMYHQAYEQSAIIEGELEAKAKVAEMLE